MLEQKLRDQQNDYFNFFEFLEYFVAIGSARRGNFSRQLYRNNVERYDSRSSLIIIRIN